MGRMTRKDNRDMPHLKPVEKIQLSEKHIKLRTALAVIFFFIGAVALIYGFISLLGGGDEGWREITASNSGEEHCAAEFVFRYDMEGNGAQVRNLSRELTDVYTKAMIDAYRIFSGNSSFEGVNNIYTVNSHPGEVLSVEPALYRAFELLEESGRREMYLAPLYVQYGNLFSSENDAQAAEFDPFVNSEAETYYRELSTFAADSEAIRLELLGDCQVRMVLSEEYARYARENGITEYIDLGWMRNAFVIDYVARILTERGYTQGVLASYDGFTRNLDRREEIYGFNLFDRREMTIYEAGIWQYRGPASMVFLRDYPMNGLDVMQYYETENGEIRFPYVDIGSGLCKASAHNLVGYSYRESCAEVLISLMPIYIGDDFDTGALQRLAEEGIFSIYCQNQIIYYTEESADIDSLHEEYGVGMYKD